MLSCVQLSFATAAYALFAFGIAVEDAVAVAWACIAAFGWFRCYMCVLLQHVPLPLHVSLHLFVLLLHELLQLLVWLLHHIVL